MSTVRCTVLSPIKFAGRVYRGGEIELPAAIAAEQERGGNVKAVPVPVLTNPQGDGDTPPATNTTATTTEPAGGTTPPAGDGESSPSPTNHPESEPAISEAGTGDRGAAVTTEPAGGTTPPAGEAVSTAPVAKPTKPKKATK
jgi:hypothetical protein